ncbi:type II secretion system major pseudopilin GspG [Candidatus Omnitrophota bacterium]
MIRTKSVKSLFKVEKAFTLIELMLVVIIIGALAAMVLPRLTGRSEQARSSAAKADIKANIATALKLFELDTGGFPSTEGGLEVLLTNPGTATNWKGPYLETKPIDPWGREYQYESPGAHRPHDYDLYSLGKDGKEGNDDITNWE